MADKKRLGKPLSELRNELYAESPGMEQDVKVMVEELRIQAQLYKARKAAGLTQQEVADRMNVNRSYISRLETNPENLKLGTLARYAQAVGMHLDVALHA
ncbi:MAG: helix-turn-helix transcriptional regulator [Pontiella sp.]